MNRKNLPKQQSKKGILPGCIMVTLLLLSFSFSFAQTAACTTGIGALPSIAFKSGSNKLLPDAKAMLTTVANKMRTNPGCKIVVKGYCSSSKDEQQLSWDHVNAIINHLVDKEGISQDRFIFSYGGDGGDCDTVDLRVAEEGEVGPTAVEPPHPNKRKTN